MPRRSKPGEPTPCRTDLGPTVLGLGSNKPHGRHGPPARILAAAIEALVAGGFKLEKTARVRQTAPLGPSARCYANGAILGQWRGTPMALLALCKQVERDFGRRPGRRWGARVLDVDIWLMGEGVIWHPDLQIPHPALPDRAFALLPLVELWASWRHPALGRTARQLLARHSRRSPVDFAGP